MSLERTIEERKEEGREGEREVKKGEGKVTREGEEGREKDESGSKGSKRWIIMHILHNTLQ